MANIRIDFQGELTDGQRITFKAPCDCSQVDKIKVYYPGGENGKVNREFVMKDSLGNTLSGIGNLFAKGAYVEALLDTNNGFAYLVNPAATSYIQNKIGEIGTIRYGTSAPSNSLGVDGDIYIQIVG